MSLEKSIEDARTCPKCSSQNSGLIKQNPSLQSHRALWECPDCGVVWRAAESKVVGWACLLVGLFMTWVEVKWIIPSKMTGFPFTFAAFFGIVVLIWGVLVLTGIAGKKEVVTVRRKGMPPVLLLPPPPGKEGWEKKCPYCGKRYPYGKTVCDIDENELMDVERAEK